MIRNRILLLCAALCMASVALAEGPLCVSVDSVAALLAPDGGEIVAPGVYDDIFAVVDGQRYAVGSRSEDGIRYALANASGEVLTDAAYAMFSEGDGAVIFAQEGFFGAMSLEGEVLLPAEYTQLAAAGEGRYLAMTTDPFDDDPDDIFLLADGEMTFTGVCSAEGLTAFSDGRMPFQDPDSELFGYLAQDGSVAVEAQFETAGRFENGAARASADGKLGLIDTGGRWLIEPEYDYLEVGGSACVGLIGREAFVVFGGDYAESFRVEGAGLEAALVGECPVLLRDGRMYVYNMKGELILETEQSATLLPGLDGQLILSDGDWGSNSVSLVGRDGVRAERADQHLIPLDGGRYAFVRMNVASYYSEVLEEIRHSVDYDSLRYGMIDSAGNEILPAEYLEIRALGNRRYLTVAEDGLRVTNENGEVLWSHLKEE